MRQCKQCWRDYDMHTNWWRYMYCSWTCANRATRIRSWNQHTQKKSMNMTPHICKLCWVTFAADADWRRKYCSKVCAHKWSIANPSKIHSRICKVCWKVFEWYANKDHCSQYCRREWRRRRNKEKNRLSMVYANAKSKYWVSRDEYDILKSTPCEICGSTEKLHIDHDHATWKVRWSLCSTCNHWLWNFRDSIENLESAIKYIKKNTVE